MQFNNTTDKNGIIQGIERELGYIDGQISGDATFLARVTQKVNDWLSIVNIWAHEVDGEQLYDDHNHGNFPIEAFDFTDNQQDYGLSTNGEQDGLSIIKVEARDATSQDYYDLGLLLQRDIPDNFWSLDKNKPSQYLLSGGSIIFDVPIDKTKADKYRITYDRQAHSFVVGDTTAKPGFNSDFHSILIYGPTMDLADNQVGIYNKCYAKIFGDGRMWEGYKKLLQKYYLNRVQQVMTTPRRQISFR